MNPFLEPTVATSQPGETWRRLSRSRGQGAPSQAHHARRAPGPAGGGARATGKPASRLVASQAPTLRSRALQGLRRARPALYAFTLTGMLMAPGAAAAVDLNAATSEQLQEVKGIGPKMARVIIEERERGGKFASIDDLSERVKGIGPKKAATLVASGLVVGGAPAGVAPAAAGSMPGGKRGR